LVNLTKFRKFYKNFQKVFFGSKKRSFEKRKLPKKEASKKRGSPGLLKLQNRTLVEKNVELAAETGRTDKTKAISKDQTVLPSFLPNEQYHLILIYFF